MPCPLGREEEWGRRCGARGFGLGRGMLVADFGGLVAESESMLNISVMNQGIARLLND